MHNTFVVRNLKEPRVLIASFTFVDLICEQWFSTSSDYVTAINTSDVNFNFRVLSVSLKSP